MKRLRLWAWGYVVLWRFALGGDPLNRPRVMWEARFKLLGIHAALASAVVSIAVLQSWIFP